MLYSFLLFIITLSLQQVYREKLASTELYTILGGLVSSILFLLVVTVKKLCQIFCYCYADIPFEFSFLRREIESLKIELKSEESIVKDYYILCLWRRRLGEEQRALYGFFITGCVLQFIGNLQESVGARTGWGAGRVPSGFVTMFFPLLAHQNQRICGRKQL